MRIIVLLKQVPGSAEAKLDRRSLRLIRDSVEGAINPADRCALEIALRLRERHGGEVEVVALSMGPEAADDSLREALGMEADGAALLSDPALAGSDAYVTSLCLARACQRLAPFDLILAGQRSIDGGCAQVGPRVAEELGLPHVGEVREVELRGGVLIVSLRWENRLIWLEVGLPALLAAAVNAVRPRYPSAAALVRACRSEVRRLTLEELGLRPEEVGQAGSRTQVVRSQAYEEGKDGVTLRGSAEQVAGELLRRLRERGALERR